MMKIPAPRPDLNPQATRIQAGDRLGNCHDAGDLALSGPAGPIKVPQVVQCKVAKVGLPSFIGDPPQQYMCI